MNRLVRTDFSSKLVYCLQVLKHSNVVFENEQGSELNINCSIGSVEEFCTGCGFCTCGCGINLNSLQNKF